MGQVIACEHERLPVVVATKQVLDMSRTDLGYPDDPDLWERLHHSCHVGVLVCGRCDERSPSRYLYLRVRHGRRELCGYSLEKIAAAGLSVETDEHYALKDKISALASRAGLTPVQESGNAAGTRRTDVVVTGGQVPVGWEVQLSPITAPQLNRRLAAASEDGLAPSWLVQRGTRAFREAIDRAPACATALMDHHEISAAPDLTVLQGLKGVQVVPCTYQRGAAWHRGLVCSGHHAQPRPLDPEGGHPSLAQMITMTAAGDVVALHWPRNVGLYKRPWLWVPATDLRRLQDVESAFLLHSGLASLLTDPTDLALRPGRAGSHLGLTAPDDLEQLFAQPAAHDPHDPLAMPAPGRYVDPDGAAAPTWSGSILGGQCFTCLYTRHRHHPTCTGQA